MRLLSKDGGHTHGYEWADKLQGELERVKATDGQTQSGRVFLCFA